MLNVCCYLLLIQCHITKPPLTFQEVWQNDTYGINGHKVFLIRYLETSKKNFFLGKTQKYVIKYLGEPDEKEYIKDMDIIYFWYNCGASTILPNGKCGPAEDVSFSIQFNNKNRKVVDTSLGIH